MPTSLELEALLKQANVPGISIATISSEGVISGQTTGVINTDTREGVVESTLFQAASLSKPVFAYIVLKMVERGMFSRPGETPESGLDRPLHEICDFGPPHLRNHPNYKLLTPRILLSHQAGLPNWFRGDEAYVATSGTRFDYSGEAYRFLNEVVEHVAGKKPLHEISREMFDKEPLKMNHSSFVPHPEGSAEQTYRAVGHNADGEPDKRVPSLPIQANPAASLVTTAEDYAKFLNACLHDNFIRRHMFEPQPRQLSLAGRDQKAMDAKVSEETLRQMSWGIGMGLQTADNGDTIAFHWGDNETSRAFTAINLRTNESAVCLTNSANGPALFRDIVEPVVGNLDAVSDWLRTREQLPLQQSVNTTSQISLEGQNAGKVNISVSGYPPAKKMVATFTYIPNPESSDTEPLHDVLLCYRDSSGQGQQVPMKKNTQGEWTYTCAILPDESREFSIHPNIKPGELQGKPDHLYIAALMNGRMISDINKNPNLPEDKKGRLAKYIYRPNGFLSDPVDDDYKLGSTETGKLVDVYFPAGYQASSTQHYNMQVMLDGDLHLRREPYDQSMGTKNILDNLIAEGKMEPVIAVFVSPTPPTNEGTLENPRFGHTPRLREYACNLETDMLLADLPRALRASGIPVTSNPSNTSLCGQSMGGLQAIYTAKRHPNIYGQVIGQSPAVWWGPSEARRTGQERKDDEVRVERDETWRAPLVNASNPQYLLDMIQSGSDTLTGDILPQGSVQVQLQAGSLEADKEKGELRQATENLAEALKISCMIHDGGHTPDAWAAGLVTMLPLAHPKRAPAPVEAINYQDAAHQYKQELLKFRASTTSTQALTQTGKIILLCGTSTAGKTSICTAVQTEARKTGHEWIVDGGDIAAEKAWTQPCEIAGKRYPSAKEHLVTAMKKYADPSVVDAAVEIFGVRTLAAAVFSRENLGHPKVDKVDLTPTPDIKTQATKIYEALSPENKAQYTPLDIENLLIIIRDCPEANLFLKQHPYPPLEDLNKHMLERAINRAKNGESTIFDIIGNEVVDGQRMLDQFHDKLKEAGLPVETGVVAVAHCPVNILMDRIEGRNSKAKAEGRIEDIRQAFFPFEQYAAIYEKAPELPDPTRPVVGVVTRQDITNAARQFGRGEDDAKSLLAALRFTDGEERISVISKGHCDAIFQTGTQSSQQIAESLCEKAFKNTPIPSDTEMRFGFG